MQHTERAMFGAGCFWGVQSSFDRVKGVVKTTVGYAGGQKKDPTYEEVCSGSTGHTEVVLVVYDPSVVTFEGLLRHFFSMHDPTTKDRQGFDLGKQYRSSIMFFDEGQRKEAEKVMGSLEKSEVFTKPVVTELVPAGPFYRAEEYHQKYHEKHGLAGCHI